MVSDIVKRLLRARGIAEEDFAAFLNPTLSDIGEVEKLPGVSEAAEVILSAVAAGREIVVFGDYDCDGISATAIMVKTLAALDAKVSAFLPERFEEGYGMSENSIKRLISEYPGTELVITVDNGINAIEQIAYLKTIGIDVVVTDHHLPTRDASGEDSVMLLPDAAAIVCPKVEADAAGRFLALCGAGVAFFLAKKIMTEAKLRQMYSGPKIGGPLLVLAGMATVTDTMPLLGVNRILVAEALKHFKVWAPIGLKELYTRAVRIASERLTSRDFGFLLGPRINAAGRVANGGESLELILSDDREIARELARIVDLRNHERRGIEQKMSDEALSKVIEGASAQVIDLPDGHQGVSGIVAARVLGKLQKVPVFVIAGGHGSARAPDGFNVRDALEACSQVLVRYGGHAAAGGFSIQEGKIDEFRRLMCEYCATVRSVESASVEEKGPDVWLSLSDVTLSLAEELLLLEPFGEANEEPVFGIKGVTFSSVKPLGSDGRHLMLSVQNSKLKGIFWNRGDLVEPLRRASAEKHDVFFCLNVSDFGERHVELRVVSIKQEGSL